MTVERANIRATIGAVEFKAKCLHLLDLVAQQRQELIITKHGRPVAKLVPLPTTRPALCGSLRGSVLDAAELVAPIEVLWEAEA